MQSMMHPMPMDHLAMSPDGRRFIEAGTDKTIRIRDAGGAAQFHAHDGPITVLVWSPTGQAIASDSADLSIKI